MSWEKVKIEGICTIVRGSSPRPQGDLRYYNGCVPRLMIEDLTRDGKYVTPKVDSLTLDGAKLSRPMKKGDLVMTVSGRTGVPAILAVDCCIHDGFVGFRNLSAEVDIDYLFHYLNSLTIVTSQQAVGAIFKNLTTDQLKNLQIPLPPLPVQKRIAEILDVADALKRKDQELLKKYDELAQAIFIDMFGDPVKNEKGWEVKTIEQIVKKQKNSIKRGPFGGALKKEIFVNDGYLVYEQYHALNDDFSFARYFIGEDKYQELIGFKVEPDDIIISCSGVYLGKLAIIPKDAKEGIINQALLKLTLDQNIYKNDFFVTVFSQKNFKEKYFDADRGAAIPNFPPMSAFKEFKFVAPPIELQEKYISIISNIKSILGIIDNSKYSNDLFNSLIQKAFKGELVL
nr:restriction endonuclease subunit S [Pedobacter sp. ASV2]